MPFGLLSGPPPFRLDADVETHLTECRACADLGYASGYVHRDLWPKTAFAQHTRHCLPCRRTDFGEMCTVGLGYFYARTLEGLIARDELEGDL